MGEGVWPGIQTHGLGLGQGGGPMPNAHSPSDRYTSLHPFCSGSLPTRGPHSAPHSSRVPPLLWMGLDSAVVFPAAGSQPGSD